MREDALRSLLLIKAVEETDRAGTLIPPADRAAATREAMREAGRGAAANAEWVGGATLSSEAQGLLARRAETLLRQLVVRHPFVDTVLSLARGPAWAGWLTVVLAAALGVGLSALDGSRRIDILSLPLLGLVLWNVLVYVLVALDAVRSSVRPGGGRRALPHWLAQSVPGRVKRLVARSAAFDAVLAEALGRFVAEWSDAGRPLVTARAVRLFHLAAAAVGLGLIAGLYLRGVVLDYRAGWESTFLEARQVHAVAAVIYAPASALTGIPIPDADYLAALRWEGSRGGESAARWIHLLAATVLMFVVLPRLLLALVATVAAWRRSRNAPLLPALVPYFRSVFGSIQGAVGRGIVAVMPFAYDPGTGALAALRRLLPAALGEGFAVDVHAPARYGDEESFLHNLADRGGAIADVIALLFSLAATPEDENHGAVITGARDWLERARRHTPLLVLVDEGPYRTRMTQAGGADRLAERREVWRTFVSARGLSACFVDLGRPGAGVGEGEDAGRLRANLWQPVVDAPD
jgi:hypothetical protein